MSLKNKTLAAIFWDVFGKLADQGAGFFVSILLARLLLPEDFGIVAMVSVILALSGSLVDMGLSTALIQKKDLEEEHFGSVFFFNLSSGFILTVFFILLAPFIADFYKIPELKNLLRVLSLLFFVNSFGNVQRAWLRKNLKYKVLSFSNISGVIVGGALGVWLAFKDYGAWALVGQGLASSLAANVYIYLSTGWKPKLIFSRRHLGELWDFGFKMFLSSLLGTVSNQLDNLIIGKLFSPASLGLFNRAKTFNGFIIRYTSGSLMSVLFPVLSKVKDDTKKYKNIVLKSFHLLNYATFLLLGILFFTIEDLVILLFTEKWLGSVIYFKIMLLFGYTYPFGSLLVNIIASKGNSKVFFRIALIKQSLNLLSLFFGFQWGIEYFLYIKAGVSFFNYNLNLFFAAKESEINSGDFYKINIKYVFLNLVVFVTLFYFNTQIAIENNLLHLIVLGSLYLLLYLVASYIFKVNAFEYLKSELLAVLQKQRIKK